MEEISGLNFTIKRENILSALSCISGIVERRNVIDALSCVQIKASQNTVTLTASDLDISIIASLEAQIFTTGEVKVSAHMAYDIIRKLPIGLDVEFRLSNTKLSITCGNSSFSVPVVTAGKIFPIEEDHFIFNFELPAADFFNFLTKIKFAMSADDARYNLNGVYIHSYKQTLCCVATDGHRLSSAKIKQKIEDDFGVIVPRKAVTEVLKVLDEKHNLIIKLSQTKIQFECSQYILTSKLVDGTFPDYEKIIPADEGMSLVIDSSKFADAIDRVSVVILDKVKPIKFFLKNNELILHSVSSDSNYATESLEVEYNGKELEIGFNSRYLLEVLSCIKGKCELIFYDENSAMLIKDRDSKSFLHLVMPMRI
ncbi:DNA polymerase III subunit beta [Candidatus Mesenet endosymbiont of Agriotes lineatus]|uniref:DNA polymerase III subunit beta n=1 Tax=Candidatus Mesenet endosymbiont of Agriotes lineatus TaxID=3077948 RepID=UPI0030CA8EB6